MKRIAILGSTGSIGCQTLEVLRSTPDRYAVACLSAHSNQSLLVEQAVRSEAEAICLTGADSADVPHLANVRIYRGCTELLRMIEEHPVDLVLNAISGAAGLRVSLRTLELGIDLALANKESLVMAGALLTSAASRSGARILPVDSEHSALLQCMRAGRSGELRRLHLTASGGPFRGRTRSELTCVSVEEALRHPVWRMGRKISVDSATLMNKALEVIEAYVLFGLDSDQIEVVVHPQAIIHSLVEFHDGSLIAHLGFPDMKIPIQYALSCPERWQRPDAGFSLAKLASLDFEPPDHETFPSILLARRACSMRASAPAVLNAANEIAVEAFLERRLPFLSIFELIERAIEEHDAEPLDDIEQVLAIDRATREKVSAWIATS